MLRAQTHQDIHSTSGIHLYVVIRENAYTYSFSETCLHLKELEAEQRVSLGTRFSNFLSASMTAPMSSLPMSDIIITSVRQLISERHSLNLTRSDILGVCARVCMCMCVSTRGPITSLSCTSNEAHRISAPPRLCLDGN